MVVLSQRPSDDDNEDGDANDDDGDADDSDDDNEYGDDDDIKQDFLTMLSH